MAESIIVSLWDGVFVSPKVSGDLIWTLCRGARNNTLYRLKCAKSQSCGTLGSWEKHGVKCVCKERKCISSLLRSLCGLWEQCHEPTAIPAGNTGSLQTHQHNVTDLNRNVKLFLRKNPSCEVESMKVSNILTAKSSRELMFLGRLFAYQRVLQTKENQNGQV